MNPTLTKDEALRTQRDAHQIRVVSPDGFLVARAEERQKPSITISLLGGERPIVTYLGHGGGISGRTPRITAIAWSPDGTRIASGASDGSLHMWDAHRGIHLRTLVDLDEAAPAQNIIWEGEMIRALSGKVVREWYA